MQGITKPSRERSPATTHYRKPDETNVSGGSVPVSNHTTMTEADLHP